MSNLIFNISTLCIMLALIACVFFNLRHVSAANSSISLQKDHKQALHIKTATVKKPIPKPRAVVVFEKDPEPEPVVKETPVVKTPTRVVPASTDVLVHLQVPFTSQAPEKIWDQPWQDACEEAAILMMDAYYKDYNLSPFFARDEIIKQVAWQTEQGWGGSIDIVDVKDAISWYMQESVNNFRIIRYPEVADIKSALAKGNPVLAVADGKTLPNPHFTSGGPDYHALVIIGYDDDAGEFITNDPGTQHGKDFRYAYDDLMNSLRDWNGGDVTEGVPVVLIRS